MTPEIAFLPFCDRFGIRLFDWQREAFAEAGRRKHGRFVYRVAGISVPRGDGKSYGAAAYGVWRLFTGPSPQHLLSAALDLDGASIVQTHARRIIKGHPVLEAAVDFRVNSVSIPETGSEWTITSREHTASRGKHPDLVDYDECGWARDDELFASLLAGQASCPDPQMLVTSTVGRRQSGPLWTVKTLAESGDPSVLWYYTTTNRSPKVTAAFLEKQRRLLLPAQYAREHQNHWVDAADSFTSQAEIDAAMGHGWTEQLEGRRDVSAVIFVDLGAVHDPSVIALGYREAGCVFIARLITFQGSHEAPVQLETVERAIRDLAASWTVSWIRIESWQGLSAAQSLQRCGLPVDLFTATAKAHSEEWPVLAQRLAARTLVLPAHLRLRDELLNLVYEVGPHGVRVTDRGKVHQDHAVAVRGVVAMLTARGVPLTDDQVAEVFRIGARELEDGPNPLSVVL